MRKNKIDKQRYSKRIMRIEQSKTRAKNELGGFKTITFVPESFEVGNLSSREKIELAMFSGVVINGCELGKGVIGFVLDGIDPSDTLKVTIKYNDKLVTQEFRDKIIYSTYVLSIRDVEKPPSKMGLEWGQKAAQGMRDGIETAKSVKLKNEELLKKINEIGLSNSYNFGVSSKDLKK
ncbi:hypothetical protein HCA73_10580 [Listeria booriae]|uniref:hypothetical protein n=1 Tax=Listeria booriae TaxID=1552123 RepID=UPI0016282164|nr:hypothetical protein [Listeria booriae]MBC1913095.1 hypothetical protein [Listeria booriae]